MSAFDAALQNFYRKPDVALLAQGLDDFLAAPTPNPIVLYALARLAELNSEARAMLEARRDRQPQFIDAVLRGFADPKFPRLSDGPPSPEELDFLWAEFFLTGSHAPVHRVVAVLDEPEVVRAKLTEWLRKKGTGFFGRRAFKKYLPVFQRCSFPIVFEESRVDGPMDLDVSVALTAKERQLKFAELPFELTHPELIRIAAKSAALWSLRSISEQHEQVAAICREEARKPGGAGRVLLVN